MPYKFCVFLLTIGFYLSLRGQDKKMVFYLHQINLSDQCKIKLQYTDSLTTYLYKAKLDAGAKMQILDQLIQKLPKNQKCPIYPKLALFKSKLFFREAKFQKAIIESEKLKTYCQKHNNPVFLMRVASLEGRVYNRIDRYDSALYNFKLALHTFKSIDTTNNKSLQKKIANIYANMARVYTNLHLDSLADVYHLKTVNLAYKIHDYERISFFYHILGWKYYRIDDYKMAEKYFLKALQDSAKIKLKIYNISNHHALGIVYDRLNQPKKALYHDSIALDFFIKTNNNTFINSIYNNIAKVYLKTHQLEKAKKYNRKAIEIAEKNKIIDNLITNKLTLAQILFASKKDDDVLLILQDLVKNNEIKDKFKKLHKKHYYKLLTDIYVRKKNYQKAFENLSIYKQYSDSLFARKLKSLSGTETKYQKELLRKRILLGQQQLEMQQKQKQKLIYSTIFLAILILGGIFLGYKFYKKYKTNQNEFEQTLEKIEKLKVALFQQKQNSSPDVNIQNFRDFLKNKYAINKIEILDVWENIANGISRAEYAQNNHISENTVKAWRKELYKKLKQQTGDTKFSDYKAVIEYFKSLRDFEYFQKS